MVAWLCSAFVGVVLLYAGVLKALDSANFLRQVRKYGLLGRALERPATLLFIAFECALGVALIVNASPLVAPIVAVLLLSFVALTFWGSRSGRVEDCGCYGGQL